MIQSNFVRVQALKQKVSTVLNNILLWKVVAKAYSVIHNRTMINCLKVYLTPIFSQFFIYLRLLFYYVIVMLSTYKDISCKRKRDKGRIWAQLSLKISFPYTYTRTYLVYDTAIQVYTDPFLIIFKIISFPLYPWSTQRLRTCVAINNLRDKRTVMPEGRCIARIVSFRNRKIRRQPCANNLSERIIHCHSYVTFLQSLKSRSIHIKFQRKE